MENIDTFEEFLKKKVQENGQQNIDWEQRKETWVNSINSFYSEIKKWLQPLVIQGLIKINDEKKLSLNEEYIGNYNVPRLDIYISNDIISLTPKGTLIIGSYGRIDMRGSKGELSIIEPKWNEWKFAKRTPKLELWDINSDSFKTVIKELV